MSTTAPIDVEKYLLQGESGEEDLLSAAGLKRSPTARSVKPPLEDALLNAYNKSGGPALKPGELPTPVEPPPPEPGILKKAGEAISSAAGTAAKIPGQIYESLPSASSVSETASTVGSAVGSVAEQLVPDVNKPRTGTNLRAAPTITGTTPPPRKTDLLTGLGEAAYTITRDVVGGAFGAATAVSDILNSQLARIARGGPMAGGPESPTHYRDIFREMQKTVNSIAYEPKSDIAKVAHKAVGGVAGLVSDVADLAGKAGQYLGLDEDRAKVLSFAAELYLFYKLDAGVRRAAPAIRAKVSEFGERMSKMKSDGDFTASGAERVAQDLYATVNRSPDASRALTEARQKLIGEAGDPGGQMARDFPVEGGPAGVSAAIDPAAIQAYKDTLRARATELRNQGAGPTRIQNELAKVPKPEPRPASEAPRPTTEPTPQPQPAPTSEAQRAAPTMERPVQPEVVVGQDTAVARPTSTRPSLADMSARPEFVQQSLRNELEMAERWGITDDIIRLASEGRVAEQIVTALRARVPSSVSNADLRTNVRSVRTAYAIPNMDEVRAGEGTLPPMPQAPTEPAEPVRPTSPVEAAATVTPETVPAPVSSESMVAAVPPVVPTPAPEPTSISVPNEFADRARQLFNDARIAGTPSERVNNLRDLKTLARDAAGKQPLYVGLRRMGFTPEEITGLEQELRKVRAKKAEAAPAAKPAVQTAASEAVLENAPAGTEVEIPAPTEPIVDTSPVIEKPKRKRRIVKAPPETPTEAATQPAPAETGEVRYYGVRGVNMLQDFVGSVPLINGGTTLPRAPIQVRATQGAKPDAIFIDTSGLSTRTKWSDIDVQQERGRMSEEIANALRENLRRQAELSGKLVEEAHTFTGQELTREATRIAAETGIDLYVKKGKNYELIPKDVVRTDARLNRGDDLAPTPISAEAAGAYVESKTSDIGPAQIREIMEAIEQGVDITDRLPSELVPHYKAMRDAERAGIDTSERRSFIDILNDLNTMLGEQGAIGGNFTREMRMAAQRLQADMRKAGKATREFLFGARPQDVAKFENYLDSINNAPPPNSTNPRNMRFDPENVIRGDRVVKHRVISRITHLEAPPLWNSEVKGLQGARDIKPGGTEWDLKSPIRQHKAAGTEFLYYAYRTAQKNLNAELGVLHSDMQEIARGFSSRSLENVGANGYQRQGGDGQRILTYNKVTPKPLTTPERQLQSKLDEVYAAFETRLNEVREATGREPLAHVDNYQTFARTINVLNHLGIKVDLARDSTADIHAKYIKHRATNFPYVVRKHAFYTAEMNALKILDTYAQAALKDIHMSPFLAKMTELIDTLLPDPVTGKETWSLQDQKPGLYKELRRWTDFLATGTNLEIPNTVRMVLNTVNKNVAYATLSGLVRSGGIQLSTLVNTSQALGMTNTLKSATEILAGHIAHPFSGGTARDFAIRNSEILSSRKFIDGYNEAAAAFTGRRPRDFFHAIRVGDFGSVQQAVGQPGFKLLELMDMEAAVITWNAAYKIAKGSKMGYSHKDSVRYADDLVVRTQGSTMPGDLVGFQRNARGKLITQFQTFLISDFNFLRDEVLSKGKTGGGGGGNIPPGGVPSGTGSWETGGKRTKTQFAINAIRLLIYTQIMNELYKMLHIQPPLPDPVEDVRKGMKEGHSLPRLAIDLAVGQAERLPFIGGMRYGKGIAGPAIETTRDLACSYRGDPLSPPWWEPTATMLGVPGTRQVSKTARALKRGENPYDSVMGWYSQETSRGGRERGERRERSSR